MYKSTSAIHSWAYLDFFYKQPVYNQLALRWKIAK